MNAWQRVVALLVVLGLGFGAAFALGGAVGPIGADDADDDRHGHGDRLVLKPADGDHDHGGAADPAAANVMDLARTAYDAGRQELTFVIRDAAGEPVTSYDVQHEKLLHLVAVRHDLGGYRHVHPELDPATGEWSQRLDLDAGSWRLYADYVPSGGSATLTQADVAVAGDFRPTEPPADSDTDTVDGYDVHLARAGSELTFHVTRDGEPVTDLEPYLGAYGHLVAIRADDLSYLHVHPEDGASGGSVGFHAALADSARYRLFFEFQHEGKVRRAELAVTTSDSDTDHEGAGDEHQH
ncbi:hypothetical protein JK386_00735 [Nocardioides sp. zg-536]|uniref:Heavy-metal-associated domain-containing protein n=1 Tax=Nocardioides faecalis TaxID=2803858 RepID=A0A939BRA6_9ACTN|nr:hypothetical protein [Nocardioides faecalis]MBM9458424.1 hypothetical protein [Nocardioides faecalis]QVI58439.1 hypothetical protein KG111_15815 [Nocardioides faecalis]